MELGFKKTINNIKLTDEEALTLYNARKILFEAERNITESLCEYNEDLLETIRCGLSGLDICNARLDVNIIVETTEWE